MPNILSSALWLVEIFSTFVNLDCLNSLYVSGSKFNSLTSYEIPILYGGSVNPNNSGQILNLENVNGVLVGGASTEYEHLVGIVNSI